MYPALITYSPPRLVMLSLRTRVNLHYACRISPSIANNFTLSCRFYSTPPKAKPTPALVQQLRKQTSCSIQKAIQALSSTGNDYEKAVEWLAKDLALSGEKATTKLAGRTAGNGLVAISPLSNGAGTERIGNLGIPLRIGMVELNCETDFVARSEVFEKLARDLAWAVGFYADSESVSVKHFQRVDVDSIMDAPMLHEPTSASSTVANSVDEGSSITSIRSAIANTVTRVGEKIILKRAASVSSQPLPLQSPTALSVGFYAHNTTAPQGSIGTSGTVAGAVLLQLRASNLRRLALPETDSGKVGAEWRADFRGLERALARQIVGFETSGVKADTTSVETGEGPMPLYSQEFHTYMPIASRNPRYGELPLDSVARALGTWGSASGMEGDSAVEVVDLLKWRVGEDS